MLTPGFPGFDAFDDGSTIDNFSLLVGHEQEAGVWLANWISAAIPTPPSALSLTVLEPPVSSSSAQRLTQ